MIIKPFANGLLINLFHSISHNINCYLFKRFKTHFTFHPTPKILYSCLKSIENNNCKFQWYKATSLYNLKQRNKFQTQARTPALFYKQHSCAHYPNNCCRFLFDIEKIFLFKYSCSIKICLKKHLNKLLHKKSKSPCWIFGGFSYLHVFTFK